MKKLGIGIALCVAVAATRPAHADLVHAITESDLWQDYSQPVFDYIVDSVPGASTARDAYDAWQDLNASDAQWEPNMDDGPQIPSSCMESGDQACQECFAGAYGKLDFVRRTLERLRAIYGSTKAYSERMIAHGDGLAPATGVASIEWNRQRAEIEQTVDHLKGTYVEKYNGLMGTLDTALHAIDTCEAQHFNERDWYSRYGFIYKTFMADRYRLPD